MYLIWSWNAKVRKMEYKIDLRSISVSDLELNIHFQRNIRLCRKRWPDPSVVTECWTWSSTL